MSEAVMEYDAKLDAKHRLTLRNANYVYYHVQEMNNGTILLEPRELVAPFEVSVNSLSMMDQSIKNYYAGRVSAPIDLSAFED